jgi:hypothetical protein
VGKVTDIVRTPFSFLFPRSRKEDLVAEHIIREHHRGRSLSEILNDAYVTNRLSPDKVERCLERPDVIHAIGEDTVAMRRDVTDAQA